jgi:hypothetical protein
MEEFSARDGLDLYNFISNTWKPSKEAALFLAFGFASSDLLHVYWREGNIVKVNSNQWPKTLIHTALRANLTLPLIRATI